MSTTTESPMQISALAGWFGGKRTLAPRIIAELGDHAAYWEIFCGSMAVTLAKPPAPMETVNDLHADLINLAKVIQDRTLGPSLYRRLRRALNDQAAFAESRERCNAYPSKCHQPPDIDRAYDYFLTLWQGMNGMAGTQRYSLGFARRMTKNGGHAAKRFASAVDSIPAWRRRLRHVTILQEDGIELAKRIEDAKGVVIYADPPYLVKGASYVHDFDGLHHLQLATALRRFEKTRVVISYYDHPDLDRLYPGWTKVHCPKTKALVSSGKRDHSHDTVAPEVLLINGESFTSSGARA